MFIELMSISNSRNNCTSMMCGCGNNINRNISSNKKKTHTKKQLSPQNLSSVQYKEDKRPP